MQVVDRLMVTDDTVTILDSTYPEFSILEDEDGIRWCAVGASLPEHLQIRAQEAGCSAFVMGIDSMCFAIDVDKEVTDPAAWKIFDRFPNFSEIIPQQIDSSELTVEDIGFVPLHSHSEFSVLDGLPHVQEMANRVKANGGKYLGLTDHGNCAGHPDLQKACDEAGIGAVMGMEGYLVDNRKLTLSDFSEPDPDKTNPESVKAYKEKREAFVKYLNDYWHIVLLATDNVGLHNLWAMSTEAFRDGLRGKNPRLDWETLEKFSEGVICTTACLRGPLWHNGLEDGKVDEAMERLGKLMKIFPGRLYIEIHTNQLDVQRECNKALVEVARTMNLPLVAASDSHYESEKDAHAHRVWLSIQTNRDVNDDSTLFQGHQDYSIIGEQGVREALSYLPDDVVEESIRSTAEIALQATARIGGDPNPPVYSKGGPEEDTQRLYDLCMSNWHKVLNKRYDESVYRQRFDYEFDMIKRKGFPGYFLMTADMTNYARENGILVGPGRGSGGGCLVAFLSNITDIDPVDAELIFERFMTEGRTELPDFDIDYPKSRKRQMQQYVMERFGEDNVTVVGSILRLKSKGIIDGLARALKSELPEEFAADHANLRSLIENAEADTAGLGMKWEDLNSKFEEELAPYREKYPELFALADKLVGRVNAYGQHAAGMIVSTDVSLTSSLPLRRAKEDGHMVAQFDKDVLEALGYVKFDLLTLRNLDTIQDTIDLVEQNRGHRVDVYSWRYEYEDPQVWDEICEAHTLGLFQIETHLGTQYAARMKPRSLSALADLVTIVRPGPRNSGLTESYIRRRDGEEEVSYPDSRMEQFLEKTYGTMLYQEDIMQTCIQLGGYTSTEADAVRKILGKKKVDKVNAAGIEFVDRVTKNGMQREDAEFLWEQIKEFAKYCVTGDTKIHLAASGPSSDGTMTVEDLHQRIHAKLLPPVKGRPKAGEEFQGPCVVCGTKEAPKWQRGACQACYVWRQKFHDVNRGVYGLTVEADGRIRPCRILMTHKHEPAQTWTIRLADGKSITATANHKHLTPTGLVRVDQLSVGDCLIVDAGYEVHRYVNGEERTTVGQRRLQGQVNRAFGEENFGFVDGGFTSLMAWTAQAPEHCERCGHDGSQHRLERAHLDGNHANNDWSNLKMLCVSCHKAYDYQFNGRRRRWGKGHLTAPVEIVSIEKASVEPVYSVVMDDPHIWIANGIATGNSFNRAHAYGYAVLSFWSAWLKYHYPVEYLTSVLSGVDKDRIPEFIEEARRMGYKVLPPDINMSGQGFRAEGLSIRYGFDSIKNVGEGVADAIQKEREENGQFTSFDDFMNRLVIPKGSPVNRGAVAHLAHVGAFDGVEPNRRGLETVLQMEKDGTSAKCVFKVDTIPVGAPNDLPCVYDWESEEAPVNPRTGKKGKKKPPPKRCSRACRNYTAPEPPKISDIEPYTPMDIGDIEQETLGVYLTVTPFDGLPEDMRAIFREQGEMATAPTGPEGIYTLAGVVSSRRPYTDRSGRAMGFVDLKLEIGSIRVVCFSSAWEQYSDILAKNQMVLVELARNSRGFTLRDAAPM